MCSRAFGAVVEYCLEDVVEYYEDFVKRSLIIITLIFGALVGMLLYLLQNIFAKGQITRTHAGVNAGAQINSRVVAVNRKCRPVATYGRRTRNVGTYVDDTNADVNIHGGDISVTCLHCIISYWQQIH